ncbi:MAG: hypothetical protein B6I24_01305 [Bacteroidetes bacterium 4572_128]|nr:MAG: hypothetical protein B6I24_01305 [Bacteroidetes bacterium 4572_128]
MFSRKKKRVENQSIEQTLNRIGEGTKIIGEIISTGVIRLEGHLKGNLITKAKLVVGQTGVIIGDIRCEDADILGTIEGKIIVSNLLSLSATAKVMGDIITSKLAVEPGAIFTGNSDMSGKNKENFSVQNDDEKKEKRKSFRK